jgi:hypothetical protein
MATCSHSSPRPPWKKNKSVHETYSARHDVDVVRVRHASMCRGTAETAPGSSQIFHPRHTLFLWSDALSRRFIIRAFFGHLSAPAVFKFCIHFSELEYSGRRKFRIISSFCANFDLITILNFRSSFVPVLVLQNSEHPKFILYDLMHHNRARPQVVLCKFRTS